MHFYTKLTLINPTVNHCDHMVKKPNKTDFSFLIKTSVE